MANSSRTARGGAQRPDAPAPDGPLDRVFAAMIVGIIVLCLAAMVLNMFGTAGGWLSGGLYQAVVLLPFVGLPIAIILMIVVTVRLGARRRRQAQRR